MAYSRVQLDLKRDLGFLLHGIRDSDARQFTLNTLQSVIVDIDKPSTFTEIGAFIDTLSLSFTDYYFRSGALLQRAELFFSGAVRDVYEISGDVFYEMDAGVWNGMLGKSAHIFIDHRDSAQSLYDQVFDYPVQDGMDAGILSVEYSGNAADFGLDIPFEALADFSHVQKERLIGIARDLSLSRDEIMDALTRLGEFSTAVILDALEFGYLKTLGGLADADVMAVIADSDADTESAEWREQEFARYVHGEWSGKFTAHAKFIAAYLKDNPLPDLNVETVLCQILIESTGDRRAEKGGHRGLMQLSREVFRDHRDKTLPDDIFDYRANLAAGMNYLQWCFDNHNPEKNLAVALANYNWGCGNMQAYRERGQTEGLKAASAETFRYLSKLLVLQRLFGNRH